MQFIDFAVFIAGWLAGNILFNAFERHVSRRKRIAKLVIILAVLYGAGVLGGRGLVYGLVLLIGAGMMLLHAWWFPKHGVNGLTAEPYDRYLQVIGKTRRNP